MNKQIKVTIALSVYNVVEYICSSLNSILAQTFSDFELLCIDDASTDGTWDYLQEFAQRDKRIRLIRQNSNKGLSASRNLAISEAKGDYILMLDGDDLFAPEMVEKAYIKAVETGADMVIWDYAVFYYEKDLLKACKEPSTLGNISPFDKAALLRLPAFTWVRLLKTSKVRGLNICFPPGLTKQDIPIHWQLITSLDSISLIPEKLSYYRQQPHSASSQRGRSMFSLAYVMDIVKDQLCNDNIYEKYKDVFLYWRVTCLYGMYDSIQPGYKNEALDLVLERLGCDEISFINAPQNGLSGAVSSFYGMVQGNRWACFKYKVYCDLRKIYRRLKK